MTKKAQEQKTRHVRFKRIILYNLKFPFLITVTLHFKRTIGPLPTPVDFFADHPFMFIMMNKDAVIFMGRVTNPTI